MIEDFYKLRNELEAEGFFKPSFPHIFYRITELIVLHCISVYLIFQGHVILGMFLFSIANGRCGWLMHEGGHSSITGSVKVDKILQAILFGLGNGMSGDYWNNQHNKHHAAPQKLGQDVDLNTLPLIAFNTSTALKGNPNYLKYQAYLFVPIITTLVTLFWGLYLHPRYMLRRKNLIELLCYALRWAFILRYLTLNLFILNAAFGGFYIFLNFSLSHTHKPVVEKDQVPNWVQYAANHTMNIQSSWWCDWWMGYLNYQIEHHLFPAMPQFRHPLIAPRVKALFEKHGLKYHVESYYDALVMTFNNLNFVGNYPH